jgi:hypothetical protein
MLCDTFNKWCINILCPNLYHSDILSSPLDHPFEDDVVFPQEISFTNLQPNHTAVYQCEASNVHGTILANANIDVLGECTREQT